MNKPSCTFKGYLFSFILTLLVSYALLVTDFDELAFQVGYHVRVVRLVTRAMYNMARVNKLKAPPSNYTRIQQHDHPRSWPDPPLDRFNHSTKIIWGYWHSGQANISPMGRVALQSWRAQHPNWIIVVMDDENYRNYVPSSHIPSTFRSLKVQHRSDILRVSVLLRYGGAYLDMTTIVIKSLDAIWDQALQQNSQRLFITSVMELEQQSTTPSTSPALDRAPTLAYLTNSVILAPKPQNPILSELLTRILSYAENPAITANQLLSRPEFARVRQHMLNKNLGVLGQEGTLLYAAHLWLFTDLVMYEQSLAAGKYIVDLPALRFTYDFFVLPHILEEHKAKQKGKDITSLTPSTTLQSSQSQLQRDRIHDWKVARIIKQAISMIKYTDYDDPQLVNSLLEGVTMMKTSTDGNTLLMKLSYQELIQAKSTLGRLYRAAIKGTGLNATLNGARPLGYSASSHL